MDSEDSFVLDLAPAQMADQALLSISALVPALTLTESPTGAIFSVAFMRSAYHRYRPARGGMSVGRPKIGKQLGI